MSLWSSRQPCSTPINHRDQGASPGPGLETDPRRANGAEEVDLSVRRPTIAGDADLWVTSKVRRCIDCVVASGALVVLGPFLLILALLVRATSRGPILFRQRRMGRHGKEFTLYKFRSMRVAEVRGPHVTVIGDSRITPVGVFLRRYKLDELPQFWNVVRGEMSLVGPRPKLPHHEGLHLPCRPGITGAATLAFRREEEFLASVPNHELDLVYEEFIKPSKARLDLEYIQSATFVTDLRLLWATVASCLGFSNEPAVEEWQVLYEQVRAERMSLAEESLSA